MTTQNTEMLSYWNSVSDTKNKNETENKERECCTFEISKVKSLKLKRLYLQQVPELWKGKFGNGNNFYVSVNLKIWQENILKHMALAKSL